MARSVVGSRLLFRLAVTGGLVVVAWVMALLFASTASADTGMGLHAPPNNGESAYSGTVASTNHATGRPSAQTAQTAVSGAVTNAPSETTGGTVVNKVPPPPPIVVTVPAAPVSAPTPVAAAAPAEPQAVPARKSVKAHKHTSKAHRVATTSHRPSAVPPPQAAPPAKPKPSADGPQAESDKTPLLPMPPAPVCPAAPGSAAAPTCDNSGHARGQLGDLGDRARVVPPYATGVTSSNAMQPPGDVTGLLSSSPD
ncbi:hypothetical protein JOD54_000747 [Actinokineospora baliensis]|uniref:hypothetical protein n=1 Tax=Actinokineospora baliensis TaxID=547056 RepID=UPI0019570597|nr:hypothetical protein [Actinokineospora baliensis]MBM7770543.1 hypothetical protein [Actinokineospora baliensis]